MPSPAMATTRPSAWSRLTSPAFWSGSTSARTSSMPSRRATASAEVRLSPVSMISADAFAVEFAQWRRPPTP